MDRDREGDGMNNRDYYELVEFDLEELRQKLADERHEDGSAPTGAPAFAERILDFISLQQEQIVGLTNTVAALGEEVRLLKKDLWVAKETG
jgi:hypothetical protein